MPLLRPILFALLAAFVVAQPVAPTFAQTKAELKAQKKAEKKLAKEWKKKAKAFVKNPLALKAKEEAFQRQVTEMNDRLHACAEEKAELQAQLNERSQAQQANTGALKNLRDSLQMFANEFERLETAYAAQKKQVKEDITMGLIFRVQVGAFERFDMSEYLEKTGETFVGESQDQMNKYTMGKFRDLTMAEAFRDDIRRLGIEDAWIVPYMDGIRINMDEARRILERGGAVPANQR